MSKHGKVYAKKVLADDTLQMDKSTGWDEFEPQFKDLMQEKPKEKSKESLELGAAQKAIVDTINEAADAISDGNIDAAIIQLRSMRGKVYEFLNSVRTHTLPEKTEEAKELIYNMLQGLDIIDDTIMPGLVQFRKTNTGNIEDLWHRTMKLTALFMGIQAVNVVANKQAFILTAIDKKILKEEEFPNYILRKEKWKSDLDNSWFDMEAAYSKVDDSFIGSNKEADFLCDKMGIIPEKAAKDHNVASIGFCPKEQKWYGWSHRAIHGFGIGDEGEEWLPDATIKKGKAETLDDAKQMAIAFADSVS